MNKLLEALEECDDKIISLPREAVVDLCRKAELLKSILDYSQITDEDIQVAHEAAFSVSGTAQHSKAMHMLIQEFPPLRWFGIAKRIKKAEDEVE